MTEPWKPRSFEAEAVYRARVRGCLLGGAVGDALGYPVEFLSLDRIRAAHGPRGVTHYVPDGDNILGRVSDDTQMTLFTVEGLRQIKESERLGRRQVERTRVIRWAYDRWLHTQTVPRPDGGPAYEGPSGGLVDEPWLYARRAPGSACLSGLGVPHSDAAWSELGEPGRVNPDSKGCGTVMRSAPFGLTGADPGTAFGFAARCAQLTHGHPTGYYAAGAFAAIVAHLVRGESLEAAVLRTLRLLAPYPRHEETATALRRALELASYDGAHASKVEELGEGWVAEEALAMAVYAALAEPDVESALLLSVNHSGDSDSTGSLCGNLLGVMHGDLALPQRWVEQVEGRARIAALADDFAAEWAGRAR
ncbi:ADP-ribosylglycohydrolase family protein [Streptomyces roseirectus]|uniref:ADP-ribosylglycohydrolase family protein n=1 Tax=Streptomyces roseirectus TaxID=2768066 RepID=A0A7H0I8Y0_9ACTN|nr:ADP-ribosylglycohydrolase family protein [Streptomyces roseirectus]QNP69246.1 ADP-ribosylglycohydrolase family protein [Streptomyces roseirectus]